MKLLRSLRSIRGRATAAAGLVFGAALLAMAIGLVLILRYTMTDAVETGLELRAADIATLIGGGTPPTNVAIDDADEGFVQLVRNGTVVAASTNIAGEPPITDAEPGSWLTTDLEIVGSSRFRIFVTRTLSPEGSVTVIVGGTLDDVDRTVTVAIVSLAVAFPLLVLLAGAMTWTVVGHALRPVEAIRAEVSEIGATDLDRRVPQPRSDDEIGRLARTMNDMLDRIEDGTRRQQRFVSDASHELRTPIAIIRHELEVALQHRATTDWEATAQEVLDEDLRMQRLVDDLLWLARHDQDRTPGEMRLVDLDEIAIRQARSHRERSDVHIDVSAVGAGQVRGKEDDLARVVQNLLDNAVRHASRQVALTISADTAGRVVLNVDDDGPGIAPESRESILERFTRIDEARARDDGGAGLGLAIVAEIVEDHGGTLSIDDSPLGGPRFTLALADARAEADDPT